MSHANEEDCDTMTRSTVLELKASNLPNSAHAAGIHQPDVPPCVVLCPVALIIDRLCDMLLS